MTGRVLVATGFGPARDLSEVHANFDDRSAACPSLHTSGARTPVATKIKLMRLGKMREPHYRIVVADARTKRDGRAIETIKVTLHESHIASAAFEGWTQGEGRTQG